MESVITWNDFKKIIPEDGKWYLAIVMPKNYDEFLNDKCRMNDWIEQFGIEILWYCNGSFWDVNKSEIVLNVSDRVLFWSELPKIRPFTENI